MIDEELLVVFETVNYAHHNSFVLSFKSITN